VGRVPEAAADRNAVRRDDRLLIVEDSDRSSRPGPDAIDPVRLADLTVAVAADLRAAAQPRVQRPSFFGPGVGADNGASNILDGRTVADLTGRTVRSHDAATFCTSGLTAAGNLGRRLA
jgi:hypothetical protein